MIITLGESDCESVGDSLLAQPVNALSSLAFSVMGVFILATLSRWEGRERTNRVIFGILMIGTGIGSFLFHGPQGPASHFLHDVTFLLTVFAVALMNVAAVVAWTEQRTLATLGVVGLVLSALLIIWPLSTNAIAGFVVLTLVSVDVAMHRSGVTRTGWWVASIITMGVALVFFMLGGTGGPLCDSSSLFQGHALWHILSGGALWIYFEATAAARTGIPT